MKFKNFLYILSACLVICSVSGIRISHHRKIEIAKKIGAAILFSRKKMMLPLPVPLPVPIPYVSTKIND